MGEECLKHAAPTILGKEQQSWYFSPHAYDYESFVAGQDKSVEYGEQYEILNAINPGKFGVEWVRRVVQGGRTAQVVTWEEALELLRIAKDASPDGNLIDKLAGVHMRKSRISLVVTESLAVGY